MRMRMPDAAVFNMPGQQGGLDHVEGLRQRARETGAGGARRQRDRRRGPEGCGDHPKARMQQDKRVTRAAQDAKILAAASRFSGPGR